MNRLERLAVLVLLLLLLAALVSVQPAASALGAVAGTVVGISVAQRLGRLRARVDARLGEDEPPPPRGLRVEAVVRRALVQLVVLGLLLVLTALVPFAGDRAFAALAAAATALPATLAAQRLVSR